MNAPSGSQWTFCAYVVRPAATQSARRVYGGQTIASRPASACGSGPREHLPVARDDHDGIAATPGSSFPSSSSRLAPPPVETHETRSASPSSLSARTESAPPTTRERVGVRRDRLGDGLRSLGEARPLEDAHRPVPEDRARARELLGEARARLGPDVEAEPAVGQIVVAADARLGVGGELRGADDVARQLDREIERAPVPQLLGHLPADEHGVGPAAEVAQHAELVLDLRAAGDEDERPLDVAEQPAEMLELVEQEQPGVRGQQMRDRLGRRVRAVRGAERVVDVEVAAVGELARVALVVLRLARVEARVLEHGDAVVGQELAQPRLDRRHRGTPRRRLFGRPRCEQTRTSAAPPSSSSWSVGSEARMRVSSATRPSSSGTLRSDADQDDLAGDVGVANGTRQRRIYAATAAGSVWPIFATRSTRRQL